MSVTTEHRRESILADVYQNGRVTIKDLAEQHAVSEATARRDLKALSETGRVELVYGGATLPHKSDYSFHSKEMRNAEAKRVIGRLAAEIVRDGDLIYLDSGTTCFAMLPHIRGRRNTSIICNSARLALELESPSVEVIMLGGQYRPDRMDTVGPLAMATLEQLRGYTAFIGADGLGMDFGVTASDVDSAHLHRLVLTNAREGVLVADHSKFLSPSLVRIDNFDAISRVVTNRPPSDEWMRYLDEKGIDVVLPKAAEVAPRQ